MLYGKVRLARHGAGDRSQADASARLGVHFQTWSKWERDDSMPDNLYTIYLLLTGQHPDNPGVKVALQSVKEK
jgi:DNA-binding transcriptional regulator YiaG